MAMQSYHNHDHMNITGTHSRLIIDITSDLLRRLEVAATQSHLSLNEYVGHVLEQTTLPEAHLIQRQKRLNHAAVEDLLRTGEAIMNAHPDMVFDSDETLYQLREERTRELEELRVLDSRYSSIAGCR
jgi:hypothetical protein